MHTPIWCWCNIRTVPHAARKACSYNQTLIWCRIWWRIDESRKCYLIIFPDLFFDLLSPSSNSPFNYSFHLRLSEKFSLTEHESRRRIMFVILLRRSEFLNQLTQKPETFISLFVAVDNTKQGWKLQRKLEFFLVFDKSETLSREYL